MNTKMVDTKKFIAWVCKYATQKSQSQLEPYQNNLAQNLLRHNTETTITKKDKAKHRNKTKISQQDNIYNKHKNNK